MPGIEFRNRYETAGASDGSQYNGLHCIPYRQSMLQYSYVALVTDATLLYT